MIPQPKNKEITIGNVLSEHTFVSGTKYWKLDKVTFESVDFKVGTRVCYIDPDEEKHVEYNGKIEWIMIGSSFIAFDIRLRSRIYFATFKSCNM